MLGEEVLGIEQGCEGFACVPSLGMGPGHVDEKADLPFG